jgi:hypothetical protein
LDALPDRVRGPRGEKIEDERETGDRPPSTSERGPRRGADGGEEARLLGPGDAFHEPKGARIAHFDNASEDEAASFVAFYLLGVGETELIEML